MANMEQGYDFRWRSCLRDVTFDTFFAYLEDAHFAALIFFDGGARVSMMVTDSESSLSELRQIAFSSSLYELNTSPSLSEEKFFALHDVLMISNIMTEECLQFPFMDHPR